MSSLTFIVGAGRSGTSLTTRVFEACGARLGDASTFAENKDAKRWINGLLGRHGFDPLGQKPLPPGPIEPTSEELDRLRFIVKDLDVVKDVKFVWVWPTLAEAFPEARFVFCYRAPQAVADSYDRAPFMKAYGRNLAAWEVWARAYQTQAFELHEANLSRSTVVLPGAFLEGADFALRSAIEASGLQWDEEAVRAVVRPDQWKSGG